MLNRLKIVVEEDGASYVVKYVGKDAAKADAALREPSANRRAFFNQPAPIQYNRPTVAPKAAAVSESAQEEPKQESKSKKK